MRYEQRSIGRLAKAGILSFSEMHVGSIKSVIIDLSQT